MTILDFSKKAEFKAPVALIESARKAAAGEGQTLSEFIRGSLRQRLRTMNDDGDGPAPMAA